MIPLLCHIRTIRSATLNTKREVIMLSPAIHNQTGNSFFHEDHAARWVSKKNKWSCKLKETFVAEYLIVPLISKNSLKNDDYWMSNQFSDYHRFCSDGSYAVFSIRTRSGERIATLGLANEQGHYHLDRCHGVSGEEVLEEVLEYYDDDGTLQQECFPTELYYVCQEIVRLMNSSTQTH